MPYYIDLICSSLGKKWTMSDLWNDSLIPPCSDQLLDLITRYKLSQRFLANDNIKGVWACHEYSFSKKFEDLKQKKTQITSNIAVDQFFLFN